MGAVHKRCLLDLGIFLPPFPYLQSNNDINFTSIPLFYRPLLWIGPRYVLANWSGKSCATPYLSVRSHCFTSHMLWRKEANIVPPVSNFTLLQMLLISPCWPLPRKDTVRCATEVSYLSIGPSFLKQENKLLPTLFSDTVFLIWCSFEMLMQENVAHNV